MAPRPVQRSGVATVETAQRRVIIRLESYMLNNCQHSYIFCHLQLWHKRHSINCEQFLVYKISICILYGHFIGVLQ